MRRGIRFIIWSAMFVSLFVLAGCWDQVELTDRALVMGVAIDQIEEGKIKLTTQIYKPTRPSGGQTVREGDAFVNIVTKEESIFEAVDDIPIHLGRKANWSHMRIIIIGEAFAREQNVKDILDFFSRDHEPRLTSNIIISNGPAGEYLEIKPQIESTSSQEIRQAMRSASERSSKSRDMNLFLLKLQMRSETGNAVMPYVSYDKEDKVLTVAGLALIKKGKLIDVVSPLQAEVLLHLKNDYKTGVIKVPCKGDEANGQLSESMEVIRSDTKIKAMLEDDETVTAKVSININGSIEELRCSDLRLVEDQHAFIDHAEDIVKGEITDMIEYLQKQKLDIMEIGDQIYRSHPKLWKSMKAEWDQRFAEIDIETEVKVTLRDTGMIGGKPVGEASD